MNEKRMYEIIEKGNWEENEWLAENPNLPEDLMYKIASSDSDKFLSAKRELAKRTDLTEEVMNKLSEDKDTYVKWNIADNLNTPKKLIYKLSENDDDYVRKGIAERKDLPVDLFYKMAEDDNQFVKVEIAKKNNLPEDLIYKMAEDESKDVKWNIAGNLNLTEDLMYKLAEDNDSLRWRIADRPDTPTDLLIRLGCDEDSGVSYKAANKILSLKSLTKDDLKAAYDLIYNSKYISKGGVAYIYNYLSERFSELNKYIVPMKDLLLRKI